MLGIRYPYEVNLAGDSAATLEALMPLLKPKVDGFWREQIEEWVEDWWQIVEARAMNEADPINGQRVLWELSAQLPDGVMIACDCGSATGWYARDVNCARECSAPPQGRWPRWDRRSRTRLRRNSHTPTGRASPWSAMGRCRWTASTS